MTAPTTSPLVAELQRVLWASHVADDEGVPQPLEDLEWRKSLTVGDVHRFWHAQPWNFERLPIRVRELVDAVGVALCEPHALSCGMRPAHGIGSVAA